MDNKDKTPKPKDTRKLKKVFEDDGYNKMNEAIGRMLKRLRKEHNMSVKDVKQRLHDDYGVDVAEKTLYNWDAGVLLETKIKIIKTTDRFYAFFTIVSLYVTYISLSMQLFAE